MRRLDRATPAAPQAELPVIDVAELAASLLSPRPPVIWDVRWSLAGNGYDAFLAGRIPGARFIDLDRDLAAPPGLGGRHPLPEPAAVAELLERTGAGEAAPVVVYGERATSIAARAWWLVRWVGHRNVRVLDGGFEAWRAAGQPVQAGPGIEALETAAAASPARAAAAVPAAAPARAAMPTVDADGAAALGAQAGSVLLDARARTRYLGEVEPVDPAPGHVPGAVSLPQSEVHRADGRLLPAAELREVFASAGVQDGVPVAASCGSGVTACSLILAAEVAGLHLALFPGSYSQWCALGRPVETG